MKIISIDDIIPGAVTEADYCTEEGTVLISKGVTITESHLAILKRRNIFDIFIKENEEINRILSTAIPEFDALEIEETYPPPRRSAGTQEPAGPPGISVLPLVKKIEPGLKGLRQLNASPLAAKLDNQFRLGHTPDRPVGPGLKEGATEMTPQERTAAYKNEMSVSYTTALADTKHILNALANGSMTDGERIRSVVTGFVKTFLTDRNILLNLSHNRHQDDLYVYTHSVNVCLLAINIAAAAGYNKEQVVEIGMGALLHDAGMLLVPREILTKKERLTRDEWFEIQKHPILGLHLLESITRLPKSIPYMAYQSHERDNAGGYPKQREKRLIHSFSKIIQVADVFIALSSRRSYREEYIPYKAMETIIKMTKKGLISGEFVKALLNYTSLFPVGSLVELNDKRIAKVIKANNTSFAKPVISILANEHGALLQPDHIYQVDLSLDIDHHISRALKLDYLPDVALMDGF